MKTKINLQHIIFSPKYRRAVLTGNIALEVEKRMREICAKKGILVHAIAVQPDHVHVFVEIPPTMPLCKAAQLIKWYSSSHTRRVFPILKVKVHKKYLWQINYFARSVGGDKRRVAKYVNNQMAKIEYKGATK